MSISLSGGGERRCGPEERISEAFLDIFQGGVIISEPLFESLVMVVGADVQEITSNIVAHMHTGRTINAMISSSAGLVYESVCYPFEEEMTINLYVDYELDGDEAVTNGLCLEEGAGKAVDDGVFFY